MTLFSCEYRAVRVFPQHEQGHTGTCCQRHDHWEAEEERLTVERQETTKGQDAQESFRLMVTRRTQSEDTIKHSSDRTSAARGHVLNRPQCKGDGAGQATLHEQGQGAHSYSLRGSTAERRSFHHLKTR